MFLDTFLNVLAVIGIVAVSAFIIVFLCDLFISIVDGSNGIFFKRNKKQKENVVDRPKLLKEPEEDLLENTKLLDKPANDIKPEDLDKANKILATEQGAIDSSNQEQPQLEQEPEANSEQEIEQEPQISEELEEETDEQMEEIISSVSLQVKEEIEKEERELHLSQENEELKKQIEELKSQIAQEQEKLSQSEEKLSESEVKVAESLAEIENLKNQPALIVEEKVPATASSKQDILDKLEVLRQRLRDNEKELSDNRKEYVPLRRVSATLEKDKKKLRRKEAIVAKRKVVLYGVNNYVDIDEEKAKELNEELELLEGLRLSVQHCEEVMEKNKERFPILERANNFLTKNQENLKADIEELEEKLKAFEDDENKDASNKDDGEVPSDATNMNPSSENATSNE